MSRETMVELKLFGAAAPFVVAASFLAIVSNSHSDNGLVNQLQPMFDLVVGILLLIAAGIVGRGVYRMYEWHTGRGFRCPKCDCPLGRERLGQWGTFRRCLGCDSAINERNYQPEPPPQQ